MGKFWGNIFSITLHSQSIKIISYGLGLYPGFFFLAYFLFLISFLSIYLQGMDYKSPISDFGPVGNSDDRFLTH